MLKDGQFQNASMSGGDISTAFPGTTSQLDAQIGQYHFYLQTLRDVPTAWSSSPGAGIPLWVPLCVVWIGYICCVIPLIMVQGRVLNSRTSAAVLTVSLAAWCVLCFRVCLAIRFALDPGRLDDLAISGLILTLTALAFVPSLLPVLAFLLSTDLPNIRRYARRLRLLPVLNLLVLMSVPILVWHIWPIFHYSLDANAVIAGPRAIYSAIYGSKMMGVFWFLWFLLSFLLWLKERREVLPRPGNILLKFEGLVNNSWRDVSLRSVKRWLVLLLPLFMFVGLINLVGLNSTGKEVFAPVCQILALAVLLVPSARTQRFAHDIPTAQRFIIGIFLVLVPFVVLPMFPVIGFQDTGGVYAGLSLFIPFLFVLWFGSHRTSFRVISLVCIALGLFAALIWIRPQTLSVMPRVVARLSSPPTLEPIGSRSSGSTRPHTRKMEPPLPNRWPMETLIAGPT